MVIREDSPSLFSTLLSHLKKGLPLIMKCDTIYGIVGMAPESEKKIREIKGREENHPFLLLIDSVERLERLTSDRLSSGLLSLWPGAVTYIFNSLNGGSVACRIPDHSLLRELVAELDAPLFSTSVNKSGSPPLSKIGAIISHFEESVGLIVDGGDQKEISSSTIVDVTTCPYKIIRQGALSIPEKLLSP